MKNLVYLPGVRREYFVSYVQKIRLEDLYIASFELEFKIDPLLYVLNF